MHTISRSIALALLPTLLSAAPYLCRNNNATYQTQAHCNTACGTTCEELDPLTSGTSGSCDTANFEGFVYSNNVTYAITKSTQFWTDTVNLALPKDKQINAVLKGIASYYGGNAWIGVYDPLKSSNYNSLDPSRFKLSNGITLTYSNWSNGQPDNKMDNADIGLTAINGEHWVYVQSDATWIDDGYHAIYGGDNKPKRKALAEWSGPLDCVNGTPKSTTSNTTGYWCGDGTGNVAQCSGGNTSSTSACISPSSWNATTLKCETSSITYSSPIETLQYRLITTDKNSNYSFFSGVTLYNGSANVNIEPQTAIRVYFQSGDNAKSGKQYNRGDLYINGVLKDTYPSTYANAAGTFTMFTRDFIPSNLNNNNTVTIEWKNLMSYDPGSQWRRAWVIWSTLSCGGGILTYDTAGTLVCQTSSSSSSEGFCAYPTVVDTTTGLCKTPMSCPLGNYQCTLINSSTIENTDSTEGANDKTDNGKTDESGHCLGTLYIFNGNDNRCRPSGVQTGFTDCCQKGTTWFGLGQCKESEKTLGKLREFGSLDGNCHYVGSYCAEKWPLVGCVQKKKTYCCFSSPLARIIQEGGRPQLGIGWGSPEAPQCRGFTPEEFQKIDFSKVNFSEWIQYDVVPNVQNNAVGNIQNVINNIDTNLAP